MRRLNAVARLASYLIPLSLFLTSLWNGLCHFLTGLWDDVCPFLIGFWNDLCPLLIDSGIDWLSWLFACLSR